MLATITVFDIVKWFLAIGLLMYIAFSLVIIRQVKVMSESIEDELNGLIIGFAWLNLALAIFLTIVTVVVL